MAKVQIPNTFRGGQVIDASDQMENFSAVVAGTSDGTKEITVKSATMATDLNATIATCDGDCTTSGEPSGERVLIPLVRSYEERAIQYSAIFPEMNRSAYDGVIDYGGYSGMLMPRSGLVRGVSVFWEYLGAAANIEFYWKVYASSIGVSGQSICCSPTISTSGSTITWATFPYSTAVSFSAGDIIYARRNVANGPLSMSTCSDTLLIEVQYT